ncbi:MAG: hypothetical protein KatS3mg060_1302 [Dehalococcoidia bacterium]|nr:MAG: hypothetical protein KatS3mg060_1302 [Dehalococcoidia bacterium]
MRQRIRLGVAVALAAGTLLTGGVVSATEIGRAGAGLLAEQATTVAIELGDYYFNPASPSLTAGSYTFVARNVGEKRHNLILDGNGIYKQTREIGFGGQDSFTVDLVPGTYKLYCDIGDHIERGMVGTLVVTAAPAAPAEPPAAEMPPAETPPADAPPCRRSAGGSASRPDRRRSAGNGRSGGGRRGRVMRRHP